MKWTEIEPKDALEIQLPQEGIEGPVNEMGEPCPWPWDPIQLKGAPLGQYHCPYCGAMVLAGMDHIDYAEGTDGPCA
jgi:hypothetical protein